MVKQLYTRQVGKYLIAILDQKKKNKTHRIKDQKKWQWMISKANVKTYQQHTTEM